MRWLSRRPCYLYPLQAADTRYYGARRTTCLLAIYQAAIRPYPGSTRDDWMRRFLRCQPQSNDDQSSQDANSHPATLGRWQHQRLSQIQQSAPVRWQAVRKMEVFWNSSPMRARARSV